MLPYPYAAGYLFLDQTVNVNKCFTFLFLACFNCMCRSLKWDLGLQHHVTFFVLKAVGVLGEDVMDWTKECRGNSTFKICWPSRTHKRKPKRVSFSLRYRDHCGIFTSTSSQVVYNACIVLPSHNAFDHRRWIFTFTHHLTRR